MKDILIIHNPRCSKSRETLKILEDHGSKFLIIDYLGGELTKELLKKVVKALKVHPKELLRTKEDEYQELTIDLDNDEAVIQAILNQPKLLERPIVLKGDQAVIGRPPENIRKLL
jgi:arsenate reductase